MSTHPFVPLGSLPALQNKVKAGQRADAPLKTGHQQPWTPRGPQAVPLPKAEAAGGEGPCSGKGPLRTPAQVTVEPRVYQGTETMTNREEFGGLEGTEPLRREGFHSMPTLQSLCHTQLSMWTTARGQHHANCKTEREAA